VLLFVRLGLFQLKLLWMALLMLLDSCTGGLRL